MPLSTASNQDSAVSAAVRKVIDEHWDGALPVDPFKIAQAMGVKVVLHDFDDETTVETGMESGQVTIRLSRKVHDEGGTRPQFALAHALGHVALHRANLPELVDNDGPERHIVRRPFNRPGGT